MPVDWLKDEWKKRRLKGGVQLTISGCLGPCDLSMVSVLTATGTLWLGAIREFRSYISLLDWASSMREAGCALPLPRELIELRFNPFQRAGQNDATGETAAC